VLVIMTRFRLFRIWLLAGVLAAGSLRCDGNTPTVPTVIEMSDGNGQSAAPGQPLPNPLVVIVKDDDGNAVPGVDVSWAAQGGGSVSSATTESNSSGRASVNRVLGPSIGQQTTTATVAGLRGSPITFVSTASPTGSGNIVITTNPPTAALTREVFDPSVQPEVVLRDDSGDPRVGLEVTATIVTGSGTLAGDVTATSDANGVAKFADLGIEGTGEHILEFTDGTESVTSSPVIISALSPDAESGKWGPVVNWDIVPLHINLLPSGKVFAWGKRDILPDTMGMPRVWDPGAGAPTTAQEITLPEMLFCAGHTLMPDGRLMIAGGHHMDDAGIKVTYFYGQDGSWTKGADMAHGRWYPTLTILPDGKVLSMAGRNEAGNVVTTPELWENNDWVELPGAGTVEIPYYPRNFVDPKNGLVFYAGERVQSRWFDVNGTGVGGGRGAWLPGPTHRYTNNRDYGSAVMYETGKILIVGGGGHSGWQQSPDNKVNTPTATAEVIDLNQTSPSWQFTGSMAFPRRHMNATILPDGQVLATGGTSGGGFVNISPGLAVRQAELWNPTTGQWTTLSANSIMRVYHSVSLLLPDGTVLHGSSGDAMAGTVEVPPERNHEIFSPPYLFKGARPTITSAPANVSYNQTFSIATPNAAQVTTVRWIRLGAVTHAFDASARASTLSFQISGGSVAVTAPADSRVAPPGHYMLFILNRNGVPSTGKIIQIQ
jgi:hypothetical protein